MACVIMKFQEQIVAKATLTGRWHDKSIITCWCWGRHSMLFTTTGLNTFDNAVSIWSNVTCKKDNEENGFITSEVEN
jgi:hypothetical protein